MKIADLASEARLNASERRDRANNLERAILQRQVKNDLAEVKTLRSRHPAMWGVARALTLMEQWRERLPGEFVSEVERDAL